METPNPVTIKCMFAHVPLLEIHRKRAPNSGTLPTPNQNRSNHIGAWGGWVVSGSPSPPVPGGGWAGSPHPATGSPRHRSRRIRQPQELGAAVHVPNRVEREQRGVLHHIGTAPRDPVVPKASGPWNPPQSHRTSEGTTGSRMGTQAKPPASSKRSRRSRR